ncbi:doxorubicin resistance ATP-binding protein DrrA [bacterium BMS3Bbin14]|nr:doxorubicin resistance ATP-binding protein DrrA [bacterium BMS3Abin13]GBE53716.1 doxorubicin resistance ATP-binding protein DrrA [bacterium BMS3Bbin14]
MKTTASPVEEQELNYAIMARSLVKRYKNTASPALNNFNLRVQKGEFFGLLGPNGAGKTTAIAILSGLFPPDSGTVLIMGTEFRRQPNKIKQISGLVPQDIALYDQLTARENLVFFGRLYGLSGQKLQDRIARCLELVALTEHAARPVSTCSGGMKRRLNLAAGLLNDPQILFLDEPTAGIDAQSRHLIHEQLSELNRSGTTILYTTHYMEEAQELCSRVGIIDSGRLVKQGSPEKLLEQSGKRNLEDLFLHLTGKQLRDT